MELDEYIENIKNIINAPIKDIKQIGRITIKKKYIVDTEENIPTSRLNIINEMLNYRFTNHHDESNGSNGSNESYGLLPRYSSLQVSPDSIMFDRANNTFRFAEIINSSRIANHDESNESDDFDSDSDELPELESVYDSDELPELELGINNNNNSDVIMNSDESDESDEIDEDLTESEVASFEYVDVD